MASAAPHDTNFALGYTAIDGDEALVGTTGTFCDPDNTPQCYTNNDPSALLSRGQSFGGRWTDANSSSDSAGYSLAPCIEVGGKWYVYASSSSS